VSDNTGVGWWPQNFGGPFRNMHVHVCYRAQFGHFTSNRTSDVKSSPGKMSSSLPAFQWHSGHQNLHGLPISDSYQPWARLVSERYETCVFGRKSQIILTPSFFDAANDGIPSEFWMNGGGAQKLEWCPYQEVREFEDRCICLDVISALDRRTDRWTNELVKHYHAVHSGAC